MSEEDEIAAWLRRQAEADWRAAMPERVPCLAPVPSVEWRAEGTRVTDGAGAQVAVFRTAREAAHAARQSPEAALGAAHAVLAVLDDYAATLAVKESCEAKLRAGEKLPPNSGYLEAYRELAVYRSVVRRLAHGYRHRDGHQPGWAP